MLRLYLYCCWSLVLFWALFVAFWWRFLGWRRRLQCIVLVWSFLRLLKLHKLVVGKLYLSMGGGLTLCHGVLDHGLNSHQNIPLTQETYRLTASCPNWDWLPAPLDLSSCSLTFVAVFFLDIQTYRSLTAWVTASTFVGSALCVYHKLENPFIQTSYGLI